MRRYPEYKASGVKWIGEIPKDWEVKKIKYTQSHLIGGVWGKEPEGNEKDIYCIRVADFNYVQLAISTRNLTLRNIPLKERDKRILSTDDLLLEKSGGGEKSPVGRTVIFDAGIPRRSVTSNFISKFTAKSDSCFPKYLLYCLSFLYHIGLTRKHIKQSTGLQNLDIDSYFQERIPFSSLTEQTQIANFLDHKTGQIDELIRIKEQRIELLQEQRTALINQVVTKGLDPNVEMKPSGVEWIGEIPRHWTLTKLKYISNIPVTYGLNIEADRYTTEGTRLIRITDIDENGGLRQKGVYLSEDCVPQEQMLNSYDLLLSRSGATVGKSYLHLEEGIYTSAGYLVRFNFGDYYTSKFIYYVTLSHFYRNWLEQQIIISTIQNVNGEKYSNFQLPIPLYQERKQIVAFLDRKTQQIDELISAERRKIELLKEYRQSLISEVVTGKIDVRSEV